MKHRTVRAGGTDLAVFCLDGDSPAGAPELVWAHGWGHTHANMLPLAQAMRRSTRSILLDLPGFGASPEPPQAWGTADYADAVAEWLNAVHAPSPASGGGSGWGPSANANNASFSLHHPHPSPPPLAGEGTAAQRWEGEGRPAARRVWIGHSFGGRVGLQLAARHPDAIGALCLIATPGLPPHRSPWQRGRLAARRLAFRVARQLTPEGPARDRLRDRFGSSDYRQATPLLRQVLVKAVNEDLGPVAAAVRVPCVLVYGDQDRDTPPDIGTRLNALMPQSRLIVLRGFGHLDILTDGQHQLVQRLGEFVERIV